MLFSKFSKLNLFFLRACFALFLTPSLNYAPKAANGLNTMGATALRQTLWDKTLRESNTLDDIWNRLKQSVDIRASEIEIPDTVFMQFQTPPSGTHKITVGMTTPLKEAFQEGTEEQMLGNEEQLELLHLSLRYNEIKKAIAYRGWGIEANDLSSTGLYGTINPKFQKAWSEVRGRRIREALMLTYASELTKAPVSLKQQFNSNIYIPNLALGDQPVWDVTDLTTTAGSEDSAGFYPDRTFSGDNSYVEELGTKLMAAAGTGSTSKAYMDVGMLTDLELYVRTRLKLMPVTIGKRRGYLFIVPSDVAAYLTNPQESGSMGSVWKDTTAMTAEEASIPGMLGRFKSLWFIEDERAPTLTVDGSVGTYTLQPGFMQHGDNDDRNLNPWSNSTDSENYVFEVGWVIGAGAIAEWIVNQLGYAKESTEYGQLLGKGSYMCGGVQLARFDVDSPDDANDSNGTGAGKTIMQRGSCMVLISRKPTSTLRAIT